ncbi:hypothetical protein I302_101076 [Kwoniella bestiolae CBS 10118]|uniref:Uncharacterized protein n=1 Tax=Kwoniella bestiolae CBS 10118 TaxID=1296100 RepID=A0A1B9G6Y5_9TREE|nr:hypothetical protein I302_04452 [Kwoniella bestiolae CBS 10118]OCF26763.1 hypothetical protein I302_04452 [Kwoniella bestiolae CBS 10118]
MHLTQSGHTASLFLILPLLVQARKYHDDPEYGDNGDLGGYDAGANPDEMGYGMSGTDDQVEMGYTGTSTNAEENENENGIEWISPSPGDVLPSGQALTVTWHSPSPIYSPSFSLCTSTDPNTATGADCGNENWPSVKDNGDGTFSAVMTMPVISQSIEKLYLSMNNPTNRGRTFNSPVFGVKGDSGVPNAYVASPVNSTTIVPTASASATFGLASEVDSTASATAFSADTLSMISTSAPVSSGTTKARVTPVRSTAVATLFTALAPTSPTPIAHTPLYPTIQAPLQATIPYAPISLSTSNASPNADNMGLAASSRENKPNIKAIALPISICGLILIAALIFCARSRVFRKTGLGRDVEKDWQSVIKEKAAASSLAASSSSLLSSAGVMGKVVEVRERRDEVPVPTLGYRGRQYSHGDERDRDRERFTEVPQVNYTRERAHRSGEYHGGDRERRHRHRQRERKEREESYYFERSRHSAKDVFDFERDRHRNNSREKGYYSTSRRSSGGIGGVYDRGYSYDKSSRSLQDPFEDTRNRPSSTRELYSSSHSSRRPSMPQKESYCAPLSNPYDPQPSLSSALASHIRRPLPEPIIRSSTNSSTRSGAHSEGVLMPRQKTLPHLSGGLRDEHDDRYQYPKIRGDGRRAGREREFESDTEAGWELAGEGRYTTGEEGMGELYENLRRAIQRG